MWRLAWHGNRRVYHSTDYCRRCRHYHPYLKQRNRIDLLSHSPGRGGWNAIYVMFKHKAWKIICPQWTGNHSRPALKAKQGKSVGFDSCDRPSNLTQIGFKSSIFQPTWPWNLMDDLKKQYGTSSILRHWCCPSLLIHRWIQTGVTVLKRSIWVKIKNVSDLGPWPFAWTSLLPLVITPENFIMMRWWEHSDKCEADEQMDGLNHS